MSDFIIIEIEDGFTIIEIQPNESPEEAAVRHGGVVVDLGPYSSWEAANDALNELQPANDEGPR
jgi:hypothetical protein